MKRVYHSGRHYIGVAHSFIVLPRVFQSIDFTQTERGQDALVPDAPPLNSRTRDGLSIQLEVSFQYKLSSDKVLSVFDKFALDYKKTIIQIARDVIRDIASDYDAFEFFTQRKQIGDAMEVALKKELLTIDITIEFVQLRDVNLPTEYENVIEAKEIQRQQIPKAQYEQEAELVVAETQLLLASKNAEIVRVNAAAESDRIRIDSYANANTTLNTIAAYSTAYKELTDSLNLTPDQLEAYVWIDTFESHDSAELIVSLEKPAILDN
jgi:regulator of protease activity HflC (stomatin/prohibitin superfamily)